MSSPNREEPELKAGHPAAVKVSGGVRITQNKNQAENEPRTKEQQEEEKRLQESAKVAANERRLLVAGSPAKKDEKHFAVEAVKSFHEKPESSHQQPHVPHDHFIQQPRRVLH